MRQDLKVPQDIRTVGLWLQDRIAYLERAYQVDWSVEAVGGVARLLMGVGGMWVLGWHNRRPTGITYIPYSTPSQSDDWPGDDSEPPPVANLTLSIAKKFVTCIEVEIPDRPGFDLVEKLFKELQAKPLPPASAPLDAGTSPRARTEEELLLDVIESEKDRVIVAAARRGLTARQIGEMPSIRRKHQTILNRLSKLRKQYGEDVVPSRKPKRKDSQQT